MVLNVWCRNARVPQDPGFMVVHYLPKKYDDVISLFALLVS